MIESLQENPVLVPPGYEIIQPAGIVLRLIRESEVFYPTERPFDAIDEELDNFLGLTLNRLCITNPGSVLRVADIGSGRTSVAAKWISNNYPQTKVVGVDLIPKKTDKQDWFVAVRGTALDLPLPNNCFDLVYCSQLLPQFSSEDIDRQLRVATEIARILKPEIGVAIIQGATLSNYLLSNQDGLREYPLNSTRLELHLNPRLIVINKFVK